MSPPDTSASRAWIDRALAAGSAVALALLAALQSGRIHPDEVYQFLEPANRLAFGYGVQSWEWHQGVRNWAIPAVLAAGMKAAHALGATGPLGHRLGAAAAVAVLAFPGLRAVLGYAARRTESAWAARLALGLVCAWATSLYFLGRTLGEPMGVLLGVAGLAILDDRARPWRAGLWAGLGLGLAVVVRYGFASLAVAALVQLALERRWKALAGAVLSGGAVALALGVLDAITWGSPWQSMVGYMRFNLGGGAARMFGTAPWWFYLPVCAWWMAWPLLAGVRRLRLRSDRMLLPAAAYLLALSTTPYKVTRFLFPVVFLVAVALAPAAADGLCALWRSGAARRGLAAAAAAAYVAISAVSYARLPDLERDLFWATMEISRDPGLKKLIVVNESIWGSGGNFYVGRDVPVLYTGPGYRGYAQAMRDPAVNRAVVFRDPSAQASLEQFGFRPVGAVGHTVMLAR